MALDGSKVAVTPSADQWKQEFGLIHLPSLGSSAHYHRNVLPGSLRIKLHPLLSLLFLLKHTIPLYAHKGVSTTTRRNLLISQLGILH